MRLTGPLRPYDATEGLMLSIGYKIPLHSALLPVNVSLEVELCGFQCNSCDSNGVLAGRWTSKYPDDCTKPWKWTGSVAIIKEYHTNGNKSVRYGQCWVFSGLVTTCEF